MWGQDDTGSMGSADPTKSGTAFVPVLVFRVGEECCEGPHPARTRRAAKQSVP